MLSVDPRIFVQVEKLSPVEKAALIIYCAVPSLTPSFELNQVLEGLRISHQNLFAVNSLTELGATWAYHANLQLFPEGVAIRSPLKSENHNDAYEDDLNCLTTDGMPLFDKLLEMISSDPNEDFPELDEDGDDLDVDDHEPIFQGDSTNFEEEIIQQAFKYWTMMDNQNGVYAGRFTAIKDNSSAEPRISNKDPFNGASFPTHSVSLNVSRVPLENNTQPTLGTSEYTQSLMEISGILAESLGIAKLPVETSNFLTTLQKLPNLANVKSTMTKNSHGLVIKVQHPGSSQSESQIMIAPNGAISNTYGLEDYYSQSPEDW
jgi:hypothetical protein